MEKTFFYIFATTAVVAALLTVTRKNPLSSAVALVVCFIALSGLYFLNDAPFAGVLQVLVYAGAIMVLVIFVIMLLNLPEVQLEEEKISKPGLMLALFLLLPLTILSVGRIQEEDLGDRPERLEDFGSISGVGELLFDKYLFQFEVVSILLLVAIVGSVILAKKRL